MHAPTAYTDHLPALLPHARLQALYQLKAQLDGLPLEAVAPQRRAARVSISEDTLLPLIGERGASGVCGPALAMYAAGAVQPQQAPVASGHCQHGERC